MANNPFKSFSPSAQETDNTPDADYNPEVYVAIVEFEQDGEEIQFKGDTRNEATCLAYEHLNSLGYYYEYETLFKEYFLDENNNGAEVVVTTMNALEEENDLD